MQRSIRSQRARPSTLTALPRLLIAALLACEGPKLEPSAPTSEIEAAPAAVAGASGSRSRPPEPSARDPVPSPARAAGEAGREAVPAAANPRESDKTVGIVEQRREGTPRVLHAVRAAANAGFDRTVFEFRDGVPGYHIEYVDRPIRDCGAGDPKPIEGDAWLEVRFFPACAHTEAGEPTVLERELHPRLTIVREIERTCDFEAVVTWVIGAASPHRYRAFELSDPPRLAIDIDH